MDKREPILAVMPPTENEKGIVLLSSDEAEASYALSMATVAFLTTCIEDGSSPAEAVKRLFVGLNVTARFKGNWPSEELCDDFGLATRAALDKAEELVQNEK